MKVSMGDVLFHPLTEAKEIKGVEHLNMWGVASVMAYTAVFGTAPSNKEAIAVLKDDVLTVNQIFDMSVAIAQAKTDKALYMLLINRAEKDLTIKMQKAFGV